MLFVIMNLVLIFEMIDDLYKKIKNIINN